MTEPSNIVLYDTSCFLQGISHMAPMKRNRLARDGLRIDRDSQRSVWRYAKTSNMQLNSPTPPTAEGVSSNGDCP